MEQSKLTTDLMIKELESNDVTHVVWLPDTETSFLYQAISKNNQIQIIPICREAESIPIAAGLWIGGKNPVVMIQNTGLFEAGDSIRGLAVDINLPLVIINTQIFCNCIKRRTCKCIKTYKKNSNK